MNEEEKKAIERCKELIKPEHSNWIGITNQKAIEIVLNLIDKQNKVIDEMSKRLEDEELYVNVNGICLYEEDCHEDCKDCIKQYFIREELEYEQDS